MSDPVNVPYSNFFLSNEVEDQLSSKLDLERFCKVDRGLEGAPGMIRKINRYSATDGTEKLEMGEGNTATITAGYVQKDYEILLAQNRFAYYDEEAMTDPLMVVTGVRHGAVDLYNTFQADIIGEFAQAELEVESQFPDFAAFVDAVALLNMEAPEDEEIFAFVCPADVAKVRKALKDDLKYVEAFSRNGYIGSVGGVNLYTTKLATEGEICGGTREAVTLFLKSGTEVEQSNIYNRSADDANIRKNVVYTRKYYFAALTNATKAFKITLTSGT